MLSRTKVLKSNSYTNKQKQNNYKMIKNTVINNKITKSSLIPTNINKSSIKHIKILLPITKLVLSNCFDINYTVIHYFLGLHYCYWLQPSFFFITVLRNLWFRTSLVSSWTSTFRSKRVVLHMLKEVIWNIIYNYSL